MSPNLLRALMSTNMEDRFAQCAAARYGNTSGRSTR